MGPDPAVVGVRRTRERGVRAVVTDTTTQPGPVGHRHRRRPSRRVRLRRTIAGVLVLLVAAVLTIRVVGTGRDADPRSGTAGAARTAAPPAASTPTSTPGNEDGSAGSETAAPARTSVPQSGTGSLHVVTAPTVANDVSGRTVRYTVEVEGGLGVDDAEVAHTVQSVLLAERGWQRVDGVRFVNVTAAQARAGADVDIRVTLASPALTDKLCAPMRTLSQVSCWNGERSVLNFRRWALGDDSYGTDVARYRIYQVNHEVGHGLGHQHRPCPGRGKRAPVMVQQTLDLGGCKPWPYPSGA